MGGDDTESTPPFFLFLFRDGGETPLTPPFFFFSQPIAGVLVIYVTCVQCFKLESKELTA